MALASETLTAEMLVPKPVPLMVIIALRTGEADLGYIDSIEAATAEAV